MPHPVLALNCNDRALDSHKGNTHYDKDITQTQSSGGFHDHDINRKNPKYLFFHTKGVILK